MRIDRSLAEACGDGAHTVTVTERTLFFISLAFPYQMIISICTVVVDKVWLAKIYQFFPRFGFACSIGDVT